MINRCTPLVLAVKPLLLYSVCYRVFILENMCVQIYRVSEKENSASLIHDEVCRSCASEFKNKGLSIEIDGHLQKYVNDENGITYYEDGSDEENPEIECSICGEYLLSEDEFLTEGILNAI